MTEKELPCYVLLSAQRALIGEITPDIRRISIGWQGFSNLSFQVIYDREPSEEQIADMEAVTGQIIADVPFQSVDLVEVIVSEVPFYEIEYCLDRIVYQRKEPIPANEGE